MRDGSEWARRVYAAVDAKDADGFVSHLTENAWFRYANADPVVGRPAIRAAVEGFFASIESLHHEITGQWQQGDDLLLRFDVRYTRQDSRSVTVPAMTVFQMEGELARRVQIYVDVSPVFAP
ncbi:MAG TPA: nuclear transport factor 2 family protein [Nitrospiria bacterium]|nr:nuclear transport factor 2 family protein [Nitrospiria bacterium]